jgi:uncharacterized protein YwgA
MNSEKKWLERIGLIAALVEKAPGQTLGRTAVMKLAYFLQVLKKVPLGYDFRLHTFGPFDADVLDDLAYAGVFGAVKERVVTQAQGYRYEIKPGKRSAHVQQESGSWLEQNLDSVDWVSQEFARYNASDLELFSTIVFADRENQKEGNVVPLEELAKQVRGIKPRFSQSYVLKKCRDALDKGFLEAVLRPGQ